MRSLVAFAAFLFIFPVCHSASAALEFTDADGVQWKRHILTEPRTDKHTLLLVIDEALNKKLPSKLILRKSFSNTEGMAMNEAIRNAREALAASFSPTLTPTANPIWPIDHQWTEQDELDYDTWIHKIAAEDFLVGGGVVVDCADYAIALRWIYSHDHHLPAGDTLAANGGLFGSWQSTVEWDALPTNADWKQDERFKASLRHVLNRTFTHTIFTDLYPVAITPDFVTPGTIYLTLETDSGHTRTIFSVGANTNCDDSSDCILIIWGNEPADEQGYITELLPYWLPADGGGFLRFRWPELTASGWQLKPAADMRGYSTEQYSWSSSAYLDTVAARLGLWQSAEDRMKMAGKNTLNLIRQRLFVAESGYLMCSLVPCTTDDPLYVSYSTPVRDQAIANSLQSFQNLLTQVDPSSPELAAFKSQTDEPFFEGAPFTTWELLSGDQYKQFNSDPRVPFFARWGVANPTPLNEASADVQISVGEFLSMRMFLVKSALNLCFPNGETAPVCDVKNPKVQALDTTRLDQGLRLLRANFLAAYQKLEKSHQDSLATELQGFSTYCGTPQDCTLYDFLLGPIDHWGVMTSNPDSPLAKRLGY